MNNSSTSDRKTGKINAKTVFSVSSVSGILILSLVVFLFLTSCGKGNTVDREGRSYLDTESGYGVDRTSSKSNEEVVHVYSSGLKGFIEPPSVETPSPASLAANSAIIIAWNERGASTVTLKTGEVADITRLGININVQTIRQDLDDGSEPRIYMFVNGDTVPSMGVGEQVHYKGNSVHIVALRTD